MIRSVISPILVVIVMLIPVALGQCADGLCGTGFPFYESCGNCPKDCCSKCGDGVCASGAEPGYEYTREAFANGVTSCNKDCYPKCDDGVCVTKPLLAATPAENSTSCPRDCAPVCGDGVCSTSPAPGYTAETSINCPRDCIAVCGDGFCARSPTNGTVETTTTCPKDCVATCGDGVCATKPINGTAETETNCRRDCRPSCNDGVCATAPASGWTPENTTNCPKDCFPVCGDGVCALVGEDIENCYRDCGTVCGDDICAIAPWPGVAAENATNCARDCAPICGDGYCYFGGDFPKEGTSCPKDCTPLCGDGTCSMKPLDGYLKENATNCPKDCAPMCGDGVCSQRPLTTHTIESSSNCAVDCAIPICGDGVCVTSPRLNANYTAETYSNCPQDCSAVCGNNVCETPSEDGFICPLDCPSLSFDGALLERWHCYPNTVCPSKSTGIPSLQLDPFLPNVPNVVAQITGFLKIKGRGDYELLLSGSNIGARLIINGATVIDAYYMQEKLSLTQKVTLPEKYIHRISINFFSVSSTTRSISISWRTLGDSSAPFKVIDSVFYSKNICGDSILDTNENCASDVIKTKSIYYTSGKGVCLEDDPNQQFTDCFSHITDTCPQVSVFPQHLFAGTPYNSDSLGNLMQNQMLWRLPGSEIMTFGVDVITGEPRLSPLFYFSYCNASTLQVVQDTYRGNTYIIPPELHAQSSPKCSFSMVSNTYSSSSEMSNEMAQNSGVSASAGAEGGWGEINGKVSAAYSKEKSVEQAKSLESKQSGSLISTEVGCETSKVKMTKNTFHPSFLEDLAQARTSDDYLKLVKRYGTHYYKRATLGGKLKQITAMSKTLSKSKTEQEQSQSAQRSFGASISSPVFSVSGDYSDSSDSSVKGSDQTDFEQQSSRSTVITYGGPPGSFGPSTSDAPSNFGDWASNIDLLPVPIDYELESITSIIPDEWKLPDGTSIKSMWNQSALEYEYRIDPDDLPMYAYPYTLFWFRTVLSEDLSLPLDTIFSIVIALNNGSSFSTIIMDQRNGNGNGQEVPFYFATTGYNLIRFEFGAPFLMTEANWQNISISSTGSITISSVQHDGTEGSYVIIHNWQDSVALHANNQANSKQWVIGGGDYNFKIFWTYRLTEGGLTSSSDTVHYEIVTIQEGFSAVHLETGATNGDRVASFPLNMTGDINYFNEWNVALPDRPIKEIWLRLGSTNIDVRSVYSLRSVWVMHAMNMTSDATKMVYTSEPGREIILSNYADDYTIITLKKSSEWNK